MLSLKKVKLFMPDEPKCTQFLPPALANNTTITPQYTYLKVVNKIK